MNVERAIEIKKMLCSCGDSCGIGNYFDFLQTIGKELKNNLNLKNIVQFSTAIASKERLIILKALENGERCVCELETILDKAQSTISHHLRKLEKANLIQSYKKGNYTYYNLKKESYNQYLDILNIEFTKL